MNKTSNSVNYSHSTNDRLLSSSVTASTFEDTAGDSGSFYRTLLRHHQSTLFMDDTTSKDSAGKGDTCGLEIASDDCNRDQKNNNDLKTPSRYVRRSTVSSGGSSAPSLYPRIVDDDEDATNISTPTRAVSENALSAPISPFYRAALEDVAYGEEDELFMLKHHERNHSSQRALASAGASATGREAKFATNTPSSFYRSALEAVINSEQELEDKIGGRQSATCSFSSSSISSGMNTPATTSVASPTVLSRSTTNESNLSQVQRRLSDISFSSSSVLPIETESIAPNLRYRSFVDDSCAFSVTRSLAMPHMTSTVLPHTVNEADTVSARSKAGLFTGKKTFCHSPEMYCSKAISTESEDDEDDEDDEDLRMAIYLSRVESSAASSLHSERTVSASISTNGSRIELEEENKEDQRSDQNLASSNFTKNDNEFLMSQFRALEKYERINRKETSSSNPSHTVTDSSSCQDHSRSASSSSSSSGAMGQRRRRSMLETRGATETQQAISNGNSHVVKCKGCKGRLQAPLHYSLVFCPKCQIVSPA